MKNKRGLSGVVVTLLTVLLVVVLVAVVWSVVSNLVDESTDSAESCYNIYGKIELNPSYTCWNDSKDYVHFSITRKDIEVDSMVVTIAGQGTTKSITLNSTESTITGMDSYPSDGTSGAISMPDQNSGKTYVYIGTDFSVAPDEIKVYAVVNGKQCEASDVINDLGNC